MGQQYSFAMKVLQDNALVLKDLTLLKHDGLEDAVKQLNRILHTFSKGKGHQILFHVKELSDETYLWKATVRIYCLKVESETGSVLTKRVLDLRQFCKLHRDIIKQVRSTCTSEEEGWETVDCNGESCGTISLEEARESLTASMIITRVDAATSKTDEDSRDECCICMDQKAEAILSCVHSFCKDCIEKWSDVQRTCPVCRNALKGSKTEVWEVPEAPSNVEIGQFVMGLAEGAGAPT